MRLRRKGGGMDWLPRFPSLQAGVSSESTRPATSPTAPCLAVDPPSAVAHNCLRSGREAMADTLHDVERLARDALQSLAAVADEAVLDAWRVTYLGRKGRLTLVLRGLASLPMEERREVGG